MKNFAFTLIELLVVIAIVGILAGILIVSMTGATNNANDARRKADINQLVQAILIAKTQDGTLPADSANCSLGSTCTGIQASLASKGITTFPKDPTTGNYYVYNRVSADDFTLTGIMSDSSSYAYDSSTSKYSSSSLTNGACGASNNTITATTPTNTCSTGTSSSVTTDSNTVLLMHMDGSDNGTTFTDQTGKTITRNGDTKTVTATKKFGTASAYFDGSSDYLSIPSSTDFDFGTGDFTIDWWFNPDTVTSDDGMFSLNSSSQIELSIAIYESKLYFNKKNEALSGTTILSSGQWYHVAMVRSGNYLKCYLNGVLEISFDVTSQTFSNSGNVLWIGQYASGAHSFQGYLDEFRISKVARWTTNFTSPNTKYYWWNWNCSGSNGGSNVTCGADKY